MSAAPKLQSPLRYIGGKHYLIHWHASRFPLSYDLFLSPFAGGLSELFHHSPAPTNEIVNDNYEDVSNFWTVLRDHTEAFVDRCLLTPFSRQLIDEIQTQSVSPDPVTRAWQFFILNRQAFSGTGTGAKTAHWSISRRVRRGINESASAFLAAVDLLPEVADRLRAVAIEHGDFETFLDRHARSASTFVYVDSPYFLGGEHPENNYYAHPFSLADHIRLANAVKRSPCRVLVCGYDSSFYRDLYKGWRCETQLTTVHASMGETKDLKTEAVFLNYIPPGV